MADDMTGLIRRCWALLETLHVLVYFAPQPAQEYDGIGLHGRKQYFASRSAPMGAVPAELAIATFYSFSPALVASALPAAWGKVTPEQALAARHRGVTATLRDILADTADEPAAECGELLRTVTGELSVAGRALFGGHAALPWPSDPLLALWHGATLVREFRGDGHVAVLLANDLGPIEACITGGLHAGLLDFNRKTRGWTEEQWAEGVDRLTARGLLDSPTDLSADGKELRTRLEAQTETLAAPGWQAIGQDGLLRLDELLTPLVRTVLKSGVLPEAISRSKR